MTSSVHLGGVPKLPSVVCTWRELKLHHTVVAAPVGHSWYSLSLRSLTLHPGAKKNGPKSPDECLNRIFTSWFTIS